MTDWQQRNLALEPHHPKVQFMANMAAAWAQRYHVEAPLKSLLVLSGPTGTGKTHTAQRLHKWARKLPLSCVVSPIFVRWPEAADAILERKLGIVEDAIEARLTVLDDLGAESDKYRSGEATDKLCQILSRREHRFTIVTTNVCVADWAARFDPRVADRFLRNSVVVDLDGVPSYSVWKLTRGEQ